MSPELQHKIGEYELREKLGQGGFGSVYKARDPGLNLDVAIKVLTSVHDEDIIARFNKEAVTLAKLKHPNVVNVLRFGVDSGRPYLVMEYLDGQPLSSVIHSGRQLPLVEKLDIIVQALEGLKHAHDHNVIHMDIKPHNLMVCAGADKSVLVKLIDFGIAQGGATKTHTNTIAGSLPYMSPEHFSEKHRRTFWCDVFSMGVVLYEMLSGGHVPFATSSDDFTVAIGKLLGNEPALPLSSWTPDLPPGLEAVVMKAINTKKLSGYDTADEFLFELSRIQESVKAQFVNELVEKLEQASAADDAESASDLADQILRIDRKNAIAGRKKFELKKKLQESSRNKQVHEICIRIEGAIQEKHFDAAEKELADARSIAPESPTVQQLQQRLHDIRQLQQKVRQLVQAAQKHGSSGRWDEARELLHRAAELDRTDTNVLRLAGDVERKSKEEHGLIEQARAFVHEHRFKEASGIIRELEGLAPHSERVVALKEMALREYRESERKSQLAALTEEVQKLAAAGEIAAARAKVEQGIAQFADEGSLIELRGKLLKRQEEQEQQRSIEQKLQQAESALAAGRFAEAGAIAEAAQRRSPDARFERVLASARARSAEQSAAKRREEYVNSAREKLKQNDPAAAMVSLEMASAESGADSEVRSLLEEARRAMQRKAQAEAAQQAEAARKSAEAEERRRAETAKAERERKEADEAERKRKEVVEAERKRKEAVEAERKRKEAAEAEAKRAEEHKRQEAEKAKAAAARSKVPSATSLFDSSPAAAAPARAPEAPTPTPAAKAKHVSAEIDLDSIASVVQGKAPAKPAAGPIAAAATSRKPLLMAVAAVVVIAIALGGYFALRPTTVAVEFQTVPTGAEVSVGSDQCTSPCSLKLATGNHSIHVKRDGYRDLDTSVEIASKQEPLTLTLAANEGPAPPNLPRVGTVSLTANVPGAAINVDGHFQDNMTGSSSQLKLEPGSHTIELQKASYQSAKQQVTVAEGKQVSLTFNLQPGAATEQVQHTFLKITAQPLAKIAIDGQASGQVASNGSATVEVTPDKRHKLELTLDGFQPLTQQISALKPGEGRPLALNLTAIPKPLPSILTFAAEPAAIETGKSTTLKWTTQNADKVTIEGLGSFAANDSKQVSPMSSTLYKLTAEGPGGRIEKNLVVNVTAPAPIVKAPQIVKFSLDTRSIKEGGSAKLTWDVQNVLGVTIDGLGPRPANGTETVSPTKTTTYRLTANSGAGEKTSDPVTLTVEAAPAPPPVSKPPIAVAPVDDSALIKNLLEQEFTSAYNSANVAAFRKIYPTAKKDLLEGLGTGRITLSCNVSLQSAVKAKASCPGGTALDTKDKKAKPQEYKPSFQLSKGPDGWIIDKYIAPR